MIKLDQLSESDGNKNWLKIAKNGLSVKKEKSDKYYSGSWKNAGFDVKKRVKIR